MNNFGFNSNGFVRQFLDKPITTYTHTTNKEVVISAVDVDTDIFTSIGHGLSNNDRVNFTPNNDVGLVYPIAIYPGGISYKPYFVINRTDDTFQLSESSGGSAVNLTTNTSMDLTKLHIERGLSDITITGLPLLQKCKLILKGKIIDKGATPSFLPSGIPYAQEWLYTGTARAWTYPNIPGMKGDICVDVEIFIDYTKYLTVKSLGVCAESTTSTTNTTTTFQFSKVSTKYQNSAFSSLVLRYLFPANGTVVEVYRV